LPDDRGVSFPSQRQLALKHGVSVKRLNELAQQGKWDDKRDQFRANAELQIQQRTMQEVAANIVKVESKSTELSLWGLNVCKELGDKVYKEAKENKNTVNIQFLERLARTMVSFKRLSTPVVERKEASINRDKINIEELNITNLKNASASELMNIVEAIYSSGVMKKSERLINAEDASFVEEIDGEG